MNYLKKKDIQFGESKEINLLEDINKHFNTKLKKLGKMHPFDFTNEEYSHYFELKSRRCRLRTYAETMIGMSKIKFIHHHPNRNYTFLFSFTDGLYYIDYDKELFDTFRVDVGGRCDRGEDEYKDHLYIPFESLSPVS